MRHLSRTEPAWMRAAAASSLVLPRRSIVRGGLALAGVATGLPLRGVLAAPGDAPVGAEQPDQRVADWDVPGGHFYTQTAPTDAPDDAGFVVADADGVSFWRDYKALGGPARFGFPISQRYEDGGILYQVLQSGVLRWLPGASGADMMPVFAALAGSDMDDWLEAHGVPRTSSHLLEDPGIPADTRLAWMTHPALRQAFMQPDLAAGLQRFGLPMGEPERFGPYLAQRFEKAALQLWLDNVPGQPERGTVTVVEVGTLLREASLIPEDALRPAGAPAPRPAAPVSPAPVASSPAPASAGAGKYIVVTLGRQWWYAYEDGALVNGGPVTTGQPALPTPAGRFAIMGKFSPYTMISPWGPSSPFYYPPSNMSFAMQITGNGVFLHDAPWRPYYGPGTNFPHRDPDGAYRTGSHGCINMPYAAAAWAYRWAPIGMRVDVTG